MNILEKDNFNAEDIQEIINSKLEESINIEFKSARALSLESSAKKEISKDVAAFANSDGGIIFYGIEEESHCASAVSYIDGNKFSKEWLENVIISNIQRKIENLKIIPIRFDNDVLKTIYVLKIPKSIDAPHISNDKKYYRRYNFQSIPMEEYEVQNLYLRHRDSKVALLGIQTKLMDNSNQIYTFDIEVQITNDGNYVAEKYKIACNINDANGASISCLGTKNYSFTNRLEHGMKISTNDMIPIFPNETFNALSFTLKIPIEKANTIFESIKCKLLAYNYTELDEWPIDLSDLLKGSLKAFIEKDSQHNAGY